MYLSRLQLNNSNRDVWRTVIDQPYKLHQFVMRGFPDGVKREDANILHRLELVDHAVTLLVQADIKPDWHSIDPQLLLPTSPFDPVPNPATKEMGELSLVSGRTLSFRLTANPTIKKVRRNDQGERQHSNRVPLVHEEKQLAWLTNKAQQHGFHILNTTITQPQKQTMWQSRPKPTDGTKQPPITLYTVQYNGHLQITDAAKFITAVQTGIGPARAFGCGLLSLAPA